MGKFDGARLGRALTNLKSAWAKGTCLHPLAPNNCTGNPINSHTIQRSRVLEAIAVDGHVLKIQLDAAALLKAGHSGQHDLISVLKSINAFEPQRLGIRDASVFPGFCGKHDHDTFAPIEEHELIFNDEQCFLLTYRPACMELWAQRSKEKTLSTALNQEGSSEYLETISADTAIALDEHFQRKAALDVILQSRTFDETHALVLQLDASPGVATAGVFPPEVDFADHQLQNIDDSDTPLQYVSYSIIPATNGGHVVIGWHGQSVIAEQFINSLLSLDPSEWSDAILRVAFKSLENTYFSSGWWAGLTDRQKNWVGWRAITGGLLNNSISYKPDGTKIAAFKTTIFRRK